MAKYRKKPIVVDAEIFTLGMEDGYASYGVFGGEFQGFFHKDEALPRNGLKPAIRTLEGWYEVEEGEHYIVTGVRGERYPVEKDIFEETYEMVGEGIAHSRTHFKSIELNEICENERILKNEEVSQMLKSLKTANKNNKNRMGDN